LLGATDLITSRGEQAEREVIELTGGGAESALECVGAKELMDTAVAIARPGGTIGYVGLRDRRPGAPARDARPTTSLASRRRHTMNAWTNDELTEFGAAEELEIAPLRRDGTLRNPVTIWIVRHGDDLYVRSVNGRAAAWFRGAQERHEAHIHAGGVDKDVLLVETDDMNDEIDAAYRTKYRRYAASVIDSIVTPEARAATLKLVPRSTRS
jgi:hypothetical protein